MTVGTTSKWISKYPSHPIPATLIRLAHGFLVSQGPQGPQVRWKEECWNFPPPTFSTKIKEEMFSTIKCHDNFLCRPWSALPACRHPNPDTRCCSRKEPPPLGPLFNSAHKHPLRQRFFLKTKTWASKLLLIIEAWLWILNNAWWKWKIEANPIIQTSGKEKKIARQPCGFKS